MCDIKTRFHTIRFPDQIHNETSMCMHMTKQQPFLEAQNFHHKLQILLQAIIECKTSSETRWSHDYFQYECISLYCSFQWCDRTTARWQFTLAYHAIFKCLITRIVRKISSCFIHGIADTNW